MKTKISLKKRRARAKERRHPAGSGAATGTYIYDQTLKRIIKISAEIPHLSGHG